MAKGNRTINIYENDVWKNVFFESVGTYVNVINQELSLNYKLEPLSNYIKIGGGYAFKTAEYKKSGVPIIRISDFNNEKIDISNCVYYNENESLSKYELNEEDIIICLTGGTIAKLGIVQTGLGKLYMNQRVGRFDVLDNSKFEKEYVYWIARSVQSIIKNLAWGAAIPNVSPKQIEKLQFSFPPIEVQQKIIEFLNDLKNNMFQNKIYFNESIESHIIELQNNSVSLKEINFELTHQVNLVKQLRQAFLREAMQGKLVKSTNTKATGLQLLEQIKAEKIQLIAEKKIKKEKALAPINKDEIPFEIPKHWTWCRLGEVTLYSEAGKSFKCVEIPVIDNEWGVVKVSAVSWNEFLENKNKKYSENEPNDISAQIKVGDFIISRANTSELVGKSVVVKKINKNLLLSDKTIRFKFSSLTSVDFVNLCNNLSYARSYYHSKGKGSSPSMKNITRDNMKELIIPLPPIHEQELIVAKLEKLMGFCDGLEQSIKESQSYNEMLLQQVLREALRPKEEVKIIPIQTKKLPNPLKTILGAHIINICNSRDFGRVKFQKLLFLVEYYCQIDFDSHYIKKAAGPHDEQLIRQIENDFNRLNFFKVEQDKLSTNHRVTYTARSGASEINGMFLENFPDESSKVNSLLMKLRPLSWEECEVVATIFAVWNNRIIKKELITDELLYTDFTVWSPRKSKLIKDFYKKLFWMKEQDIIPEGWGNYVNEPSLK